MLMPAKCGSSLAALRLSKACEMGISQIMSVRSYGVVALTVAHDV